jgi:hypothetical protein
MFKNNCLRCVVWLCSAAVAGGLAYAQTPDEARVAILREVNADGALIALAVHCRHAPDDVNRLGDKLEALTMARAKARAVVLDANTYHEAARDGFEHMREVLRLSTHGDEGQREQCEEARGRIARVMAP